MNSLEAIMLKIFIALNFSIYNLFWIALMLWFFQAFVVYGIEKLVLGKAIGLQWYDVFLTIVIGMAFCASIYLMGDIKQKVGYVIEINRINVTVKGDE